MVGKTEHPECDFRMNYRAIILIEKGPSLSFTAILIGGEYSEYSGNNAWNYNGNNGNVNVNNKNNTNTVRPVSRIS